MRPPAFIGELADFHLDFERRTAVAVIALDLLDVGRFFTTVGVPVPPGSEQRRDDATPGVVVLACPRVGHPKRDEDRIAEAAIKTLRVLVNANALSRTPEMGALFADLVEDLRQLPDPPVNVETSLP